MSINVIQHDFTMEHFPLRQNMILTTSFFFFLFATVRTAGFKKIGK
jgi:hypothetical protein